MTEEEFDELFKKDYETPTKPLELEVEIKQALIIKNEEEKLKSINDLIDLIKETNCDAVILDVTNEKSDDAFSNHTSSIYKADIEDPSLFRYVIKWMKIFKENSEWWKVYKDAK